MPKYLYFIILMLFLVFPVEAHAAEDTGSIDYQYLITRFRQDNWEQTDYDDRLIYIESLMQELSKELVCPIPAFTWMSEEQTSVELLGKYQPSINLMSINSAYFCEGETLRETITHEMRHAWQDWQHEQQTEFGINLYYQQKAYEVMFLSQLTSDDILISYNAYQGQPVEADAFQYSALKESQYQYIDDNFIY